MERKPEGCPTRQAAPFPQVHYHLRRRIYPQHQHPDYALPLPVLFMPAEAHTASCKCRPASAVPDACRIREFARGASR